MPNKFATSALADQQFGLIAVVLVDSDMRAIRFLLRLRTSRKCSHIRGGILFDRLVRLLRHLTGRRGLLQLRTSRKCFHNRGGILFDRLVCLLLLSRGKLVLQLRTSRKCSHIRGGIRFDRLVRLLLFTDSVSCQRRRSFIVFLLFFTIAIVAIVCTFRVHRRYPR